MGKNRDIKSETADSISAAFRDQITILSIITIACIVALWVAAAL